MISKKIAAASVAAASVLLLGGCQTALQTPQQTGNQTGNTNASVSVTPPTAADTSGGPKKISQTTNVLSIVSGGGSKERPKGAPGDLPNLPDGTDFSWGGGADAGIFIYAATGTDQADVCNQQMDLLANAGWAYHSELSTDYSNAVVRIMKKTGHTLSVTCAANADTGRVDLFLDESVEQ